MRVFFDANILLDILTRREPHYTASQAMLDVCDSLGTEVFISWHSVATAFYVMARKEGRQKASEALHDTLTVMTVASVGQTEALRAFELGFDDLEDAMQAVSAEAAGVLYIITRDVGGFTKSSVPTLSPEEFVANFQTRT
jgi:predicted nucleic acid-binding protein